MNEAVLLFILAGSVEFFSMEKHLTAVGQIDIKLKNVIGSLLTKLSFTPSKIFYIGTYQSDIIFKVTTKNKILLETGSFVRSFLSFIKQRNLHNF